MVKQQLYKKYAKYYDKIHDKFDQKKESEFINWAVDKHKLSEGNYLLDVACGTGRHIEFLKDYYKILGVDINPEMLKIARLKIPEVKFMKGDM
jgi:ubiquinone/menaquinone biosynthesis C-methylase UbiE